MKLSLGLYVNVKNKKGIIRFIGPTEFAPGTWVGIELFEPTGKNNGTIDNVQYFTCSKPGLYGIFVSPSLISLDDGQDNHTKLEGIVEKLQTKLQDTLKKLEAHKLQIDDLESQLETITVDREYYRNTNEIISQDLKELQHKYDELLKETELLRKELEMNQALEAEINQINADNNYDTSILIRKMKNLETQLDGLKRSYEMSQTELNSLKSATISTKEYVTLKENLKTSEDVIEMLRLELEALDDPDQISSLTLENAKLTVKIEALTKQVEELNKLQDYNDDLEENYLAIELQLAETIAKLTQELQIAKTTSLSLKDPQVQSIIENLKLELHSKTRDYKHCKFLLKIAQVQFNTINDDHIQLRLHSVAFKEIRDYILDDNLKDYLGLLSDITDIIDITEFIGLNATLKSMTTVILQHVEDEIISEFNVAEIENVITNIFQTIKSNVIFNKCCLKFVEFHCRRFNPQELNWLKPKLEAVVFDQEVNERYNIKPFFDTFTDYSTIFETTFTIVEKHNPFNHELAHKEKTIKDLELTISLMESNLNTLDSNHNATINELHLKLSDINNDYDQLKLQYETLIRNNQHLSEEITNLLNTGEFFKLSYVKSKFGDIKSEREFVDNIRLVEEITDLRKLVATNNHAPKDLNWLKLTIISRESATSRLFQVSNKLRIIARSAEILPMTTNKPRKNAKFVVSMMNEQFYKYINERNEVLMES